MSSIATLNGTQYIVPQYNDTGWAQGAGNLSLYLAAIAANTLQPTGGSFTLTADVDFGASFGLKALFLKTETANPASAGVVRLAKTDSIKWRNNANGADIALAIDGSDNLTYAATKVLLSGAVVNADINGSAAIAYSKLALTGSIVNADINASAAIAMTKLAALTASRVPVLDGSGFITASTITATTLAFLDATSSIQTQLNGKQASGTYIANPLIADLAAGSHKITGLASGSTSGDAITWGQAFTSGQITFNPTTTGIKGTTTSDNAAAGNVGEYVEALVSSGTSFATSATNSDATSISLTAGDWELSATLYGSIKGTTTTLVTIGISQTSGNSTTGLVLGSNYFSLPMPVGSASQETSGCIAGYRQSLSGTIPIYFKILATYSGTTPTYGCRLSARRIR